VLLALWNGCFNCYYQSRLFQEHKTINTGSKADLDVRFFRDDFEVARYNASNAVLWIAGRLRTNKPAHALWCHNEVSHILTAPFGVAAADVNNDKLTSTKKL
jgi:hypothetical protein